MAKTFTTFGLKDVAIAVVPTSPNTTPTWVDIPSVEQAGGKMSVSEVEQWGDDKYQGTFYHSQKCQITVKGNKHSMEVFEMLSGNTLSSSGAVEQMYFGTEAELQPPRVMVRGTVTARNEDGTYDDMYIYWFSCDVKTLWESGPGGERAKMGEVQLQFNSYPSTVDEEGNALAGSIPYAFGRFDI